jgi:hypothetical protein
VPILALSVMLLAGCVPEPAGEAADTGSPTPGTVGEDMAPLPTPAPDESVVIATYGAGTGSVFASGIVPDRSNEEGTCTLVATAGGDERSADLEAGPTPAAMNCGEITVDVPSGEWTLRLDYSSGDFVGHSGTVTVTVP